VPIDRSFRSNSVRYDLRNTKLLALSIALTMATLGLVELLPERTLSLTASGAASGPYLINSEATQGTEAVRWVDAAQRKLHCHYTVRKDYMGCGLVYVLTPDGKPDQGLDLHRFDRIEIDMSYEGPSPLVRLAARNLDRRFSKVEDTNSARFHSVNLRRRDIVKPVQVELNELTVPDWWIVRYDLPREFNRPGLENAISVLIDMPLMEANQHHEMQLRSLTLKGRWIHRDQVYLGILCAWLLGAVLTVANGWAQLRHSHSRQQREIDALTARTRQLRVEQEKLRRLATIDELTGVLNRRGLEQALNDYEDAAQGMTLVMLDIDHFKRINDRLGHDCGDEVLKRVAAVVAANLRASDVLGRYGGEEFVIACQGTRLRDATRLAEKLRERVEQNEVRNGGVRISVTASFGVALAPPGGSATDALKRADAALYRAKEAGRNRVEVDKTLQSDAPTTV
jgi:diguanylate cyclase (GGDEF)-like protein